MSLIAKDKGGADFTPIAAGMHHAICYGVVDIGTQPSMNPRFPARRKVVFIWELPDERADFEREIDGEKRRVNLPRAISSRFTLSLAPKSNLRPMLESWRGRPFTEQELEGFDLHNVCGTNCLLNIVHEVKDGKTYANVKTVNPLPKGMPKRTAENPPLKFSLDDVKGAAVSFPSNMPDWIKAAIMSSDEYVKREQQSGAPAPGGEPSTNAWASEEDVPF